MFPQLCAYFGLKLTATTRHGWFLLLVAFYSLSLFPVADNIQLLIPPRTHSGLTLPNIANNSTFHMISKPPVFRCSTQNARVQLATELDLPYDSYMQDWEWEVAKKNDIEKYIEHYRTLLEDDKKFTLMEIIIQATTDQDNNLQLEKYWNVIKRYLKDNFKVHEYSIYYWSSFEMENLDECWKITPYMRQVWKDCNVG